MVDYVDVDSGSDIGPGQVEWLHVGPADAPGGAGPRQRGRRPWYLLAAAIAVAVIVVVALNRDTKHNAAARTHPPTVTAPTTTAPPSDAPSSTEPPPVVVTTGSQLLDVPAGWDLFARGPDHVVRIELARGRITRTTVPALENTGAGFSFVVGRDRVIVQSTEVGSGYVVPDGRPAGDLPASFEQNAPVLPGPDVDHVWVPAHSSPQSAMVLVGLDGRPAGPTIRVPVAPGAVGADGAGYVQFYATGGTYDARPDAIKRITSGNLLATGPTRWLTVECDEQFRCATTVIDRATGARHAIAASAYNYSNGGFASGVIAPDGSSAAITQIEGQEGTPMLYLLDLSTGHARATKVILNSEQAFSGGALVWSPDSRWLFIAADAGRLLVLDRRTMHTTALAANIPQIQQIAFRGG